MDNSYLLGKKFFEKHQDKLVWFANTWIGRRVLYLHGHRSSVGSHKIIKIIPNAIFWTEGANVKAEFRTHNKFTKRLYYSGYPLWWLIHQWDMIVANTFIPRWNLGFDTLTVRPDADPENSSVDGYVQNFVGNGTWSAVHDATTGTAIDDSSANSFLVLGVSGAAANTWDQILRGFLLFNTSGLGGGTTISAAVLSYYTPTETIGGQSNLRNDLEGSNSESVNIVASNPASNTSLATGDFDAYSTTTFSTAKNISTGHTLDAYNDYTLNASGIANVDVSGVSKFAALLSRDIANTPQTTPGGNTFAIVAVDFADKSGTSTDPKLVLTYTPAVTTSSTSTSTSTSTTTSTSSTTTSTSTSTSSSSSSTSSSSTTTVLPNPEIVGDPGYYYPFGGDIIFE